jgi:hypothetical protein
MLTLPLRVWSAAVSSGWLVYASWLGAPTLTAKGEVRGSFWTKNDWLPAVSR